MESSNRLDQSAMVFEYLQQRNFHVDMEKSLKGHQDTSWVKGHLLTNMHDSKTNVSSTWALNTPADFKSWSALEFQINCKKILDSECRGAFDVIPWLWKLIYFCWSFHLICIIKVSRNRYDVSLKLPYCNDLAENYENDCNLKPLMTWSVCSVTRKPPSKF